MEIEMIDVRPGDAIAPMWESWRNFEAFKVAAISEFRNSEGVLFVRYIDSNGVNGSVKAVQRCKLISRGN